MKKISVVIPVFNVGNFIQECVESIINQTLKEIEILAIDDGSSDSSIDKIKDYKDNRIHIYRKQNRGLSSTRNYGLYKAKGEYIYFIDGDDFLLNKDALKNMYELATRKKCDIVMGNAKLYYSKNSMKDMKRKDQFEENEVMSSRDYILRGFTNNHYIPPVCFNLYKKSVIIENNINFKDDIFHEDELFSPKVILKSKRIGIYKEQFYAYRQREGSIMNSQKNDAKIESICYITKKLLELYQHIDDKQKQSILKKRAIQVFLSSNYVYRYKKVNIKFRYKILCEAIGSKDKIKAFLYFLNPTVYYKINEISKRVESNE